MLRGGFSLGDLITLVTTITTGVFFIIRTLLSIRDAVRDVKATLGAAAPERKGLLGKVAEIEEEVEDLKEKHQQHREWMIEHEDRRQKDRGVESRRGLSIRKQGL